MFGGLNRLLVAAVVAGAVLVVPPAAFACNGGVSAVAVYKECLGTGGGAKATSGGSGTHTSNSTPAHISPRTAQALKQAGKDGKAISALITGYGASRFLQSHSSGAETQPTAIGSAFDLGSGPTVLLIVLASSAALLLGGTGMRVRRNRHRP